MRAMVIDAFGGPERLHMADVPKPAVADDGVLVQVAYTSVNPVDWKIREGWLAELFPHEFPLIPGWDASGTVVEVGAAVSELSVGDAVYAYCRKPTVQWGSYAEFIALPASAVAPKPASLSHREAATIPLVGLTCWQALYDTAGLEAGESVLIHAGAGGLGSLAIPLAKHAGARVVTTASATNHDYVRGLGADVAIDYRNEDVVAAVLAAEPEGVDAVFATVGGEVMARSYEALKPGGILVSVTDQPDETLADRHQVRHAFVFVEPNGAQLRDLANLIDTGVIRPPAVTEMGLEEAAAAQAASQEGHVRGKIALKVA